MNCSLWIHMYIYINLPCHTYTLTSFRDYYACKCYSSNYKFYICLALVQLNKIKSWRVIDLSCIEWKCWIMLEIFWYLLEWNIFNLKQTLLVKVMGQFFGSIWSPSISKAYKIKIKYTNRQKFVSEYTCFTVKCHLISESMRISRFHYIDIL